MWWSLLIFWCGAFFHHLSLWWGAALDGAAVPSFFGVVLLSPLGWWCLLLPPCGWWCHMLVVCTPARSHPCVMPSHLKFLLKGRCCKEGEISTTHTTPQNFSPDHHHHPKQQRWPTAGARLHAKNAFCAGLSCGRSLPVVSSGCVGARLFEDTTRRSMDFVVRVALGVYEGGAWVLWCRSLYKGVNVCFSAVNRSTQYESTPALHDDLNAGRQPKKSVYRPLESQKVASERCQDWWKASRRQLWSEHKGRNEVVAPSLTPVVWRKQCPSFFCLSARFRQCLLNGTNHFHLFIMFRVLFKFIACFHVYCGLFDVLHQKYFLTLVSLVLRITKFSTCDLFLSSVLSLHQKRYRWIKLSA